MKSKIIFFFCSGKDVPAHRIPPMHTVALTAMVQFYYPYKGALMWTNKIKDVGVYK